MNAQIGEDCKCVRLRKKNTSAAVKPLTQRKKWKPTKKNGTKNSHALTTPPSSPFLIQTPLFYIPYIQTLVNAFI
jgi:hypothetical protein